jgi:Asp-tRNA(Asn)/Glu-tRNA(Gln) amidotransferase A subunit family amidase
MPSYNLESISLPSMAGGMLSIFTSAVESPLIRPLLIGRLMKQGGVDRLRKLTLDEPPTFYPIYYPDESQKGEAETEAIDMLQAERKSEVPFKTWRDYAEAYREGRTTPVKVAQRVLECIAESDQGQPPLRAFVANDRQDVLAQAEAAAKRYEEGHPFSPIDGVPVAIKDEVDQMPYPTRVGTTFMGNTPARQDCTVVARLRKAGALLVGKANMHEIGINPNGSNAHYGHVRNPYDMQRDTGGSSSGPAAAVAAGLVPVAIGADGGGSIRIPSSLCGLVGLMSTFGRVSEFGAAPLSWSVGHLGPLAASVEDAAVVYAIIAGPDPLDPNTLHQPPVKMEGWNNPDLRGLKLGLYREWFDHSTQDVRQVCHTLLDKLAQAGAEVVEVEVPELDEMRIAHVISILGEMATSMANYPNHAKDLAASVRLTLRLGKEFTAKDYLAAQRVRTRAMHIFSRVLAEVDAIITPATAMTAPVIPQAGIPGGWSDLSADTEMMRYVFPGNLAGLPAISIPAGYDGQGLPVGMQAMGRPWEEHTLLRIATAAEGVVQRRLPAKFYRILD